MSFLLQHAFDIWVFSGFVVLFGLGTGLRTIVSENLLPFDRHFVSSRPVWCEVRVLLSSFFWFRYAAPRNQHPRKRGSARRLK